MHATEPLRSKMGADMITDANVATDGHVPGRHPWRWVFAIAALEISLLTVIMATSGEPKRLTGLWVLDVARDVAISIIFLSPLSYTVCYPIYRLFAERSDATLKSSVVGWVLWCACIILVVAMITAALYANLSAHEPRRAKAQTDTRSIAMAIALYIEHCGGLPADSSLTNCPATAEPGGPYVVPRSLLLRQTNAQGQIAGPFLDSFPKLPTYWTGAGSSYAYYILPGKFLLCAWGDGLAVSSADPSIRVNACYALAAPTP
jgi:hypothetical protein